MYIMHPYNKDKNNDKLNILLIVGTVAIGILGLILGWAYPNGIEIENPMKICEAQGGEYNDFRGGSICVKDGLIIDMD